MAVNSAWGLLAPGVAIFLLQDIAGGNPAAAAKIAGFGTLSYWVVKSIFQIPIAVYLDENHGEIDDFWFFLVGTTMTGFIPFGFLFATQPWHIYLLEALHAVGMALVVPSSSAIFIRHADKGREALESGLNSTVLGIGVGITGAVGGVLVAYVGFHAIFILTGIFTLLSAFLIYGIREDMLPKVPRKIHEFPIEKGLK